MNLAKHTPPVSVQTITPAIYLKESKHPLVVDSFARMKRGDINYIDAVERIAAVLVAEAMNK